MGYISRKKHIIMMSSLEQILPASFGGKIYSAARLTVSCPRTALRRCFLVALLLVLPAVAQPVRPCRECGGTGKVTGWFGDTECGKCDDGWQIQGDWRPAWVTQPWGKEADVAIKDEPVK